MGAAAEHRGCANLTRPFQDAIDHANYVEESLRLLAAADRAVEFCREVNGAIATIQGGKGIAAAQRRAYLNCHVGQTRMVKYLAACAAWRDAHDQRSVAFRALEMRKAAEFLMAWVPGMKG